jgi:hypothetical protein
LAPPHRPCDENVKYSPDQPFPATFGIPARSVDFDRHSNICLRVSQQSFPAAGIGLTRGTIAEYVPICRSIIEAHGGRLWATQ